MYYVFEEIIDITYHVVAEDENQISPCDPPKKAPSEHEQNPIKKKERDVVY